MNKALKQLKQSIKQLNIEIKETDKYIKVNTQTGYSNYRDLYNE